MHTINSTVRAARDAYLTENGFDTKAYTASTFEVEAFGRRYTFKNTHDRKWAIPLHDLHHVATGYGTDLIGEAEIGAFELVGGCKTSIVYVLNVVAVLTGFAIAPLRTWSAFVEARKAKARALYRFENSADGLLDLSVVELRERLRLPTGGLRRPSAARRQPWWFAVLGLVNGLSALGTVLFELGRSMSLEGIPLQGFARVVSYGVAGAAALMAATAVSTRSGSLLGRALFGHAAMALIVLNLISVAVLHMALPLALFACAVPFILLAKLSF